MYITRQARVLDKVDRFLAKESAALTVREANHRAVSLITIHSLCEETERLNLPLTAVETARLLSSILKPTQQTEEQEDKVLETQNLHQEVYRRQRLIKEVCNRGRPVFHRDIGKEGRVAQHVVRKCNNSRRVV